MSRRKNPSFSRRSYGQALNSSRSDESGYGYFKKAGTTECAAPVEVAEPEAPQKPESEAPQKPESKAEEEGEILERPIQDILGNRNPVMYCHDQSKMRGLNLEWELISETGPPHDKTFTWSLTVGDIKVTGSGNTKKGAKSKAAEEMARKLDQLPKMRPQKRNYNQMFYSGPYHRFPSPNIFGHFPPGFPDTSLQHHPGNRFPKKKKPNPNEASDSASLSQNSSQNNSISKLFEYCRKKQFPEPVFVTLSENVLESRATGKGYAIKKVEFTLQVEVNGKKYKGSALTKKQAKHQAASAAWAEIGGGVEQCSIDSFLQSHRNNSSP